MSTIAKWTVSLAAGCIAALVVPGVPANAEEASVSIASGRAGGLYYPVAGGICTLVNERTDEHGITCTVEFGVGSLTNIEAMRDGEVSFALAQSDTHRDALIGAGPFEQAGPYDDLRSVMALFVEQVTIVTRKDKDIRSFADLKGKRVYTSEPGSGGHLILQHLFEAEGWQPGDVTEFTDADYTAPDVAQALCDNEIDAFSITVGHPSPLVKEAALMCDVMLIPLAGAAAQALIESDSLYAASTIPGGLYRGNDDDVAGLGLVATLVTTTDVSPEIVYEMTRDFFEGIDRLRAASPLFNSLEIPQMANDGLSAPLHEGAARYYAEAGLR